MKTLFGIATAAALLVSAPAFATPAISSLSFKAGLFVDRNAAAQTMSAFAGSLGFTPFDGNALSVLDTIAPYSAVGFASITDFSLNMPDPNVPVTLSMSFGLTGQGSIGNNQIQQPISLTTADLPFLTDPFLGAPALTINSFTNSAFGVTFPDAASLEAAIHAAIADIVSLIPPVAADASFGGFALGQFSGSAPGVGDVSGYGIIGGLTVDPAPILAGLKGIFAPGLPPLNPNDVLDANLLLDGTITLTATPQIIDPPPPGPSEVPVPASIVLLGAGIAGLAGLARRRKG
jgi:hypothetical protein